MTDIASDLVLGVDEAGRGPILGPMVMALVGLRPRKAAGLTRAGVMDSKKFGAGDDAHAARLALVPRILEAATHHEIVVVEVDEIDRRCLLGELNRLEQERADDMLRRAPPAKRIVADGVKLFRPLRAAWPMLEARDGAEAHHVAVAAASVLAKVRRDERYGEIVARYRPDFGDVVGKGGGYCNAATRAFLRAYVERHRALPPEARRSWPWEFARDLLGAYDPRSEIPGWEKLQSAQMSLFADEN